MGQQQLLLLVLAIVIVGIAMVAGINSFMEGRNKANRNAAATDAMRVASAVQEWKSRPTPNGGGKDASGFTGVTFPAIGIAGASLNGSGKYPTSTACLALAGGTNATITIYEQDCSTEIATVTIAGTRADDISWNYAS